MSTRRSFVAQIARACREHPDRDAFFIQGHAHSYRSLAGRVYAIREMLDRDAFSEENIGVVAHDDIQTYAAVVAIWFAGKTMVPLVPTHPPDRNALIVQRASLRFVLSSRDGDVEKTTRERVPGMNLAVTADLVATQRTGEAPREANPESAAYILFTSGSTGVPKGVPISYRALNGFLDAFEALGLQLGLSDRFLQMFDLTFDLSLMAYCVPLTLGACAFTVPPDAIKYTYVLRLLEERQLTCALMVPSILARLRPHMEEIRLPDLRVSMFCGEALHEDLAKAWLVCAPKSRVLNVYGPTEATIFCTSYTCERGRPNKSANGIVCIGKPMDGVDVCIADADGRSLPLGTKGELCLGGRQLTQGYWRDPERNAVAFFERDGVFWYRTGDLCSIDDEGDIAYTGRVDHQAKIQGYRVELSEIEHHVRAITGVKQVAAIARATPTGETTIELFVEGSPSDAKALTSALKARVPVYMIPAKVTWLADLPLNANGKIDRRALEEQGRADAGSSPSRNG